MNIVATGWKPAAALLCVALVAGGVVWIQRDAAAHALAEQRTKVLADSLADAKRHTAASDSARGVALLAAAHAAIVSQRAAERAHAADSARLVADSVAKHAAAQVTQHGDTIFVDSLSVVLPARVADAVAEERRTGAAALEATRTALDASKAEVVTVRREVGVLRAALVADSTDLRSWRARAEIAERLGDAIKQIAQPSFLSRVLKGGCTAMFASGGAVSVAAAGSSAKQQLAGAAIGGAGGAVLGLLACTKL